MKHFLGKGRAIHRLKTVHVGNFLDMGALPPAPPAWGWEYASKIDPKKWGMLGNGPDTLNGSPFQGCGNCVVAKAYHFITLWTGNTGNPLYGTTEQAVGVYSTLSGFDPATGANDNGLDMQVFADYWKSTGIPCTDSNGNTVTHKILGYASVDIHNVPLLNQCAYLFEGHDCGLQLPESAEENTDDWDFDPSSPIAGGHDAPRFGMGRDGGHMLSWALSIPHTNPFLINTLDETYVYVSEDQLNLQGKTPSGFDREGLLNAMSAV